MPHSPQSQLNRQDAIRDLLAAGPTATQQLLVDELNGLGFEATQSSVSRDLREIGAIKTVAGYELPSPVGDMEDEIAGIADLVRGMT